MGFIDLEKAYNMVNREVLWQVFRMYDVEVKLMSGIKRIYVDSSACFRVKWGECQQFRIDNGVKQVYHVHLAFQYIHGWSAEGGEDGDGKEESESE